MRTVWLVAGGVAGGSLLVLPSNRPVMRLAARVLMLALLPAVAAARGSCWSAARQGTAAGTGEVSAR